MHCPKNYGFNQIGNLTDQCAMKDNFFVEPFTELWKKLLGTAAYLLNLFGCLIMLAFVGFERQGFGSYYRTALNQLNSWILILVSKEIKFNWCKQILFS